MTHWSDLPTATVPPRDDSWDRPDYDRLAALPHAELLRVAWNLRGANYSLEWQALDLAQDLSCEFEMADYNLWKPEYRHEESVSRQERGLVYMKRAYALAGFTEDRRADIADAAEELRRTGRTTI